MNFLILGLGWALAAKPTDAARAAPTPPASPSMRSFADLPMVPPRAAFLQTEAEAEALVRQILQPYERPGAAATVEYSEGTIYPTFDERTRSIQLRRFVTTDASWARAELARLAAASGSKLGLDAWSDADVLDAWHAFWIAQIAHQYGHFLRDTWGRSDPEDVVAEERAAARLESAVLHDLADRGRIPSRWPDQHARLLRTWAAGIPGPERAKLPPAGPARDALLTSAVAEGLLGSASEDTLRSAFYLVLLESQAAADAPVPLDDALMEQLARHPRLMQDLAAKQAQRILTAAGFGPAQRLPTTDPEAALLIFRDPQGRQVGLWITESRFVIRASQPVHGSRRREARLLGLCNDWTRDLIGWSVILTEDGLTISSGQRSTWGGVGAPMNDAIVVLNAIGPSAAGYLDRSLSRDEAAAGPMAILTEEGLTW